MRAIVNTGPNQLEWRDLPVPEPAVGQVRIRTAACGICATDLRMISGWDRITYPAIPGHEWSGTVDEVGDGVETTWIGRHCVGYNILSDGGEIGFEHPGGYAEYFLTEAANLYFLPGSMAFDEATLIEPLAVCMRGMKRLRLEDRDSAAVFGDGPIGLLMLCLLRREGVDHIVLAGGRNERLKLAGDIGADNTFNYHQFDDNLSSEIRRTRPAGFSNVIEATGSANAMSACLEVVREKGKILIMGEYGAGRFDIPGNRLLLHELELIGSNASEGSWDDALRSAVEGAIPLSKLISCSVPAEEFEKGIDKARNSRGIVKIVIKWLR